MNTKIRVVLFLWITFFCVSALVGGFDLIGDMTIRWAIYIWVGTGLAMTIITTAIVFFTYSCINCEVLVFIRDNYCKQCGSALIQTLQVEKLPSMTPKP